MKEERGTVRVPPDPASSRSGFSPPCEGRENPIQGAGQEHLGKSVFADGVPHRNVIRKEPKSEAFITSDTGMEITSKMPIQ